MKLQDIDIITERKDGTTAAPPPYVHNLPPNTPNHEC